MLVEIGLYWHPDLYYVHGISLGWVDKPPEPYETLLSCNIAETPSDC